jgi:RND family efflux transporter MFP subunit
MEHAPQAQDKSRRGGNNTVLWLLIVLVVILIVLTVLNGLLARHDVKLSLARATQAEATVKVSLINPKPGPTTRSLVLPGNVAAWYEAPIYGQVSGYIGAWYKDYGAKVRKGDVLATIQTPYLDEQLDKAKSSLAVAEARDRLAVVTAARWASLSGTQAVAQQQVDVYAADEAAQKQEVAAQQHNVRRFEAREAFKNLVAPFDGVVTLRHTDIGAYVNASGGDTVEDGEPGHSSELFRVADVHEVRIFVDVPQDFAGALKPGVNASFTIAQYPGRLFQAHLLTTARAVTAASRTVVTELTSGNEDGVLWPGTYATVHFEVPTRDGILVVPAQSVLFGVKGLFVCQVGADNRVHIKPVTAGRNLGAQLQIIEGLSATDRIVASPTEDLSEGQQVDIVSAP